MPNLDSYELTHPELLSEQQLCEILKNSCIEILNFEKLHKNELLEMYKRIAMPLPQRKRGSTNNLDNTEEDMEKSDIVVKDNDKHSLITNANRGSKRLSQTSHPETDRSKPPINDQKSMSKKIRLNSTPKVETICNGINKRKCEEQNVDSLTKKRQKITWP